jgi:3-deoxy-D-manno-octulosonate 8-phosphate phosphatase (KDO 8-P phosphatase)
MKPAVRRRIQHIRCLLLDVDGVLTDGKLHFTSDGKEFKSFDALDGHGIKMAQRAGLLVGFVSGRHSEATTNRAADLEVNILKQSPVNKAELMAEVQREHHLAAEEIAFVGDELVDLPAMRLAGLAVAVANAVPEVKKIAHYVTRRRGGDGAVREVIEMILKARGLWQKVTARYMVMLTAALLTAGIVCTPP